MKFSTAQGLQYHKEALPMTDSDSAITYRWVGVDVNKTTLDVYDLSNQSHAQYENSEVGIATLYEHLQNDCHLRVNRHP